MSVQFSKNARPRLSGVAAALVAGLLTMGAHQAANASSLTLTTGQTGAQTQIDAAHTSWWTFTVPEGDNLSAIYGYLTIKLGPSTTAAVSLNVYEGTPFGPSGYGDTSSSSASVYATSGPIGPTGMTQSFVQYGTPPNADLFSFAVNPILVGGVGGTPYTVALQSDAADTQSTAYFIKGGPATVVVTPSLIAPEPPPPLDPGVNDVPLPGSAALLALGMLGMGAVRRRQSH